MAKKFMYVCFGILALVVVFHLGAKYGQAGYVDQSWTGVVAESGDGRYLLFDDGQVWAKESGLWELRGDLTPPIPVSQVKFWWATRVLSTDDEIWNWHGGTTWTNDGGPPGSVLTQPTTWSQIKGEFGE